MPDTDKDDAVQDLDRVLDELADRVAEMVEKRLGGAPVATAVRGLFSALDAAEEGLETARGHAAFLDETLAVIPPPPPRE